MRARDESRGDTGSMMEFDEMTGDLDNTQVQELLCQALETEIGGVQIYETAIRCAQNDELKEEWAKYLEETRNHERILREVFEKADLEPDTDTAGRRVVKHNGEALVKAMEMALEDGEPDAAQLVAAECVVLAETKDHFNWELIGEIAGHVEGALGEALTDAFEEVEDQEDEHLYHTKGWARELWFESFGLPAKLPPPEESGNVRTATGAARIQARRTRDVKRSGKRSGNGATTRSSTQRSAGSKRGKGGRGTQGRKRVRSSRR